ncbi:tubulin beta-2 chain-like protein [Lates japonicus]|uniref:Tubulin beta-2 chain-like protein n=1 Tax=Lates japonicus TaxID=270547 RepID=A0AAD3M8S1_LATJO|nr:tubulin beta-2 chain-like protein [Lates japonicus]
MVKCSHTRPRVYFPAAYVHEDARRVIWGFIGGRRGSCHPGGFEFGTMDSAEPGSLWADLSDLTTLSLARGGAETTGPRVTTQRESAGGPGPDARGKRQSCDCLQGFQLTHTPWWYRPHGCTSSSAKIRQEYPDQTMNNTFSVVPSQVSYDIRFRTLKLHHPTYGDLNHLVSATMSGGPPAHAFLGSSTPTRTRQHVLPLHFFMPGSLLTSRVQPQYRAPVCARATQQINTKNMMAAWHPPRRHLTAGRGQGRMSSEMAATSHRNKAGHPGAFQAIPEQFTAMPGPQGLPSTDKIWVQPRQGSRTASRYSVSSFSLALLFTTRRAAENSQDYGQDNLEDCGGNNSE